MSRAQVEQMLAEVGLSADEAPDLVDVLAPLDEQAEAPRPSPELAALFEGRSVPAPPPGPAAPRTRALAGVLVLAVSGVGATGLSAAANTLPGPLQHQVSEFSRHYLPFDLPEPPDRPARSAPAPSHALPHQVPLEERDTDDPSEASRSLADRPGAATPDGSEEQSSQPQSAPTTAAQPSTAPSASPSPSSPAKPSSPSSPSTSPSPGTGHGSEHDKDQGKDPGKDQGKDKGKDKGKGPSDPGKDRPRSPGGGNEAPQPGSGEGSGQDAGESPGPGPGLPLPPLPLPDLPPDLPGNGIDVTVE